MKLSLACIACGRELHQVDDDSSENQPYGGTAFVSHGHYGSTAYDPMDGRFIEINVCDICLVTHAERVVEGRDRKPVMEDGTVIGWEDVKWQSIPWKPTEKSIEWVISCGIKYNLIEIADSAKGERDGSSAEADHAAEDTETRVQDRHTRL